jgi:hypothetical protein
MPTTLNGVVSDHVAGLWLAVFTPAWFSLHTSDPYQDGPKETEVVGGSYARQQGVFGRLNPASARTIWLETNLTWRGLPEIQVTHIGVWDKDVNGNWMSACSLPGDGRKVANGASFVLGANTYAIQIGIPG